MSAMESPHSTEQDSIYEQCAKVQSAPEVCWNRLRTVFFAVRSTRKILEDYQCQLEAGGHLYHLIEAHKIVSRIQNLQTAVARRYKTVESMKRLYTKKRISVMKVNERLEEENSQTQLRNGLLTSQMRLEISSSSLNMRRKSLAVLMKITAMRRRTLLMDVSNFLHIMVRLSSVSQEQESACKTTTVEHGLEDLVDLAYSKGLEVSSALGHIVHFLESISRLLDYTFRYPLKSCASTSSVHCSKRSKSFSLYWSRWRSGRDNFEQAVHLLEKNIAQISEDNRFSLVYVNL